MKKILITGANSYIGISFENYMKQWADEYSVDTVDMIDGTWCEKDFSSYDVVFHVAGIAHKKETKENAHLYYKVNRDLAIETAKKAKSDGVKQFVFLSSMSVYGMDVGVITKETVPTPKSNYGKSKLEAENGMNVFACDDFKICTLRPPMVYGNGCRGNFQTVVKIVKKLPFFPKIHNQRSMVYIDHLCAFVKKCVDCGLGGLYFPQNQEYMDTYEMAKEISAEIGKKVWFSFLLGWGISFIRLFVPMAKKAFGTLIYENTEDFQFDYCTNNLQSTIRKSV